MTDLADANSRNPDIQISRSGRHLLLEVKSCHVSMAYDGAYNVWFRISRRKYAGKVRGLCGNCDQNKNNDFVARGQTSGTSLGAFINSWEVFDDTNIGHM